MSDVGDNNFVRYIYRGEEGERIPLHATHITVHESVTVIRAEAFCRHRNIVEVICHDRVKKVEQEAFYYCPVLRRVIMPGVTSIEYGAFMHCDALMDVDCGKLERIGEGAFCICKVLRSINLPSAEIVESEAFYNCEALADVKFGNKLERIKGGAFGSCDSLVRIAIPLKEYIFDDETDDDSFSCCFALNHIDLVEGVLHETMASLQLEAWRIALDREIDSINQILRDTSAGDGGFDDREKSETIQEWIRLICRLLRYYKWEHQRILDESADALEVALPRDIVTKNVLSFLRLPS